MEKVQCENCLKNFEKRDAFDEKDDRFFCSYKCSFDWSEKLIRRDFKI